LSEVDKKYIEKNYEYFRYVDDILVLCDKDDSHNIANEIVNDFKTIGLKIYDPNDKGGKSTLGVLCEDMFTYLGYKFEPNMVTVREKSLDKLRDSITSIFTAYKYSKKYSKKMNENFLLWRLNLRITGCIFDNKRKGWLFFFSEITDLGLLHRLDHYITILQKRFNLDIKPKKFIRAYYQLKHHVYESNYIPNYDEYSLVDMKKVLIDYFGYKGLDRMADEKIEYLFKKKLSKQVKDLDSDLQNPGFS